MKIGFDVPIASENAVAFAEQQLPCYAGRLRQITEEEYLREFGDD